MPYFFQFGGSRSRGLYIVGIGENRTLTYAKKKRHTNAGALDAGYQYKTQNLLITI